MKQIPCYNPPFLRSASLIALWPLCPYHVVIPLLAITILPMVTRGQDAADVAVQLTASVQASPPQISLTWPSSSDATGYTVYRRLRGTDWTSLASLPNNATDYTDTSVSIGQAYEYRIDKSVNATNVRSRGYIVSGIEVPLADSRGKVILIVDNTYASALSSELARFEMDLIGDGWGVIRHDVSRSDAPPNVKALIQGDYNADPNSVQALILFGHVPVPYSGCLAPDGHFDHLGAWPADLYYGDMTGTWTDTIDCSTSSYCQGGTCSTDPRQINVHGDGKFDQSYAYEVGSVTMEIGRIDLANMPSFAPNTELDLLRQYLNKDHRYRAALLKVQQRGFIDDNWGGRPYAANGFRNFAPLVGTSNITATSNDYFTTLSTQSYLWSYGCGPGWFQGAGGVGQTSDFAMYDTQTVFTMLFGSYFADWDTQDNFLRAPLATTTYGLTCAWAGQPNWYLHHMGLGETIGYGARLAQNYDSAYYEFPGWVHVALMGDPTLRLYPIAPASRLSVYPNQLCSVNRSSEVCAPAPGVATLLWQPSRDQSVIGYNLYRSDAAHPSWTRVNQQVITGTSYTDTTNAGGNVDNTNWMLRAVKLQTTPSGSYYDASEGIFATTYRCGLPNSLWGCGPEPWCACQPL